ncbi:hypothetical protein [Notoacmeibacter sp. MSK16QG-6]|uniref:hypothetical protein n=1 Tax=Notoacmeibacter sp. MSK16QG-6 TaxID=2957982 RepID=UPI00209F69FF|nr:hypothetical protein [Notoacmeibacter sp. MSK16QG-6]MCP1200068.1 hypothetical protein [Notoacmeibacter sp. MSK16QG-6]
MIAEDDEEEPEMILAERARIDAMVVFCPVCDEEMAFENTDFEFDPFDNVRIREDERYRRCEGCDNLIDFGWPGFDLTVRDA